MTNHLQFHVGGLYFEQSLISLFSAPMNIAYEAINRLFKVSHKISTKLHTNPLQISLKQL